MKKSKKIIAILLLIITFSFSFQTLNTEKVEASSVALGYAMFKLGVSFVSFTTFAQMFYVNGYHMQISDLMTLYADKYYNYSNGVYIAKEEKLNVLEKFNLYTSALLSGNLANIPNAFDLQAIRDSITKDFPQKVNTESLVVDTDYLGSRYGGSSMPNFLVNNQGFLEIAPEYLGKLVKVTIRSDLPDYFYYIDFTNYGWFKINTNYFPTIRIIDASGQSIPFILDRFQPSILAVNINTAEQKFVVGVGTLTGASPTTQINILYRNNYVNVDNSLVGYITKPDSYSQGVKEWVNPYPNYYSALNNKASNTDDLLNLMNVDEYLQREIARLIENSEVNKENSLILPELNTDGSVVYPGADIPDNPTIPWNPGEAWYNNLIGVVLNIPDLLNQKITDLVDDKITPGLDIIKDTVTSIPGKIAEIPTILIGLTDLTMDAPLEQIDMSKLKLDGIITKFPFSIPFDYIHLLNNFKREPIPPDLTIKLNTSYFNVEHDINIQPINKYLVFFRWFVLITFVYGLMLITRKVIKW